MSKITTSSSQYLLKVVKLNVLDSMIRSENVQNLFIEILGYTPCSMIVKCFP